MKAKRGMEVLLHSLLTSALDRSNIGKEPRNSMNMRLGGRPSRSIPARNRTPGLPARSPLNTPTLTVSLSQTDQRVRVQNTVKRSLGRITKFNFQTANMENAYATSNIVNAHVKWTRKYVRSGSHLRTSHQMVIYIQLHFLTTRGGGSRWIQNSTGLSRFTVSDAGAIRQH
jgi:hypothetical protein